MSSASPTGSAEGPTPTLSLSVVLNGERIVALPTLGAHVDIGTIKMLIGAETNLSAGSLVLLFRSRVLLDTQTLQQVGVSNNDMLEARTGGAAASPGVGMGGGTAAPVPSSRSHGPVTNSLGIPDSILHNPAEARQFIRSNPGLLFQIEVQNPSLYRAIMNDNDLKPFAEMWKLVVENMQRRMREAEERARLAEADPFDPEVQRRIEEEIRLKNVQDNWEAAMESSPESFGRVTMLYVPMKVNGMDLKAFVDSGAQSTIMSESCAERCGIKRLIDHRYAGIARGVGQARIVGRVHSVTCKIGELYLAMSFTILESQGVDFLFGLDQLKKLQACIDLKENCLVIQDQKIPFLAEKDLPPEARMDEMEDDEKASSSSSSSSRQAASGSSSAAGSATTASQPPPPTPVPAASSSHSAGHAAAAASASNAAAVSAAHRRAGLPDPSPPTLSSASHAASPAVSVSTSHPASIPAAAATPNRPATASSPATGTATVTASNPPISESSIDTLVQLGFSRQDSIAALRRFGGNVDQAASFLFSS